MSHHILPIAPCLSKDKSCQKCKILKPYSDYHKCKTFPDGYHRQCKSCRLAWHFQNHEREKARMRAAYHANKEQRLAYKKVYIVENKEKVRETSKKYWQNNKNKKRAKDKRYYLKHRSEHAQRTKEWKRQHPKAVLLNVHRRLAKLRAVTIGKITKKDIDRLLLIQKNKCHWCKVKIGEKTFQIDHIFPLSKGGPHRLGNICLTCRSCNIRKSNKLPHEFCGRLF